MVHSSNESAEPDSKKPRATKCMDIKCHVQHHLLLVSTSTSAQDTLNYLYLYEINQNLINLRTSLHRPVYTDPGDRGPGDESPCFSYMIESQGQL